MRLSDTIPQQLSDLATFLEQVPDRDTPPGQAQWADLHLALQEHAIFLRQFIIWKVEERFANTPTRAPEVLRRSGRVYEEERDEDIKSSYDPQMFHRNP